MAHTSCVRPYWNFTGDWRGIKWIIINKFYESGPHTSTIYAMVKAFCHWFPTLVNNANVFFFHSFKQCEFHKDSNESFPRTNKWCENTFLSKYLGKLAIIKL